MKNNYKIEYFNNCLALKNNFLFLRVINKHNENKIDLVWWYDDKYRHEGTIGQWRIKRK